MDLLGRFMPRFSLRGVKFGVKCGFLNKDGFSLFAELMAI